MVIEYPRLSEERRRNHVFTENRTPTPSFSDPTGNTSLNLSRCRYLRNLSTGTYQWSYLFDVLGCVDRMGQRVV
jgi:hypothetical protein